MAWGVQEGITFAKDDKKAEMHSELLTKLDARRFDYSRRPEKPIPLFVIGEKSIATRGNLVAVQGQAKVGKTALKSALIAAWMRPGEEFLGVLCPQSSGALVHFDSEQSPFDHWTTCATALRRAELSECPPELRSYYLTDLPLNVRKEAFRLELERAKQECGTIHAVLLDGLGDLCLSPNDEAEAFHLVAEMHAFAIQFDTAIFCTLHENEGSGNTKMRGHLGSQLTRKAETNLRLQKSVDGSTVVFTEKSRHCQISKEEGPRFAWDNEAGTHMPIAISADAVSAAKAASMRTTLEEVFRDAEPGGMRRCDLLEQIAKEERLKPGGARDRFDRMNKAGLLIKTDAGKWRMSL